VKGNVGITRFSELQKRLEEMTAENIAINQALAVSYQEQNKLRKASKD
jgi:hypothetical protein